VKERGRNRQTERPNLGILFFNWMESTCIPGVLASTRMAKASCRDKCEILGQFDDLSCHRVPRVLVRMIPRGFCNCGAGRPGGGGAKGTGTRSAYGLLIATRSAESRSRGAAVTLAKVAYNVLARAISASPIRILNVAYGHCRGSVKRRVPTTPVRATSRCQPRTLITGLNPPRSSYRKELRAAPEQQRHEDGEGGLDDAHTHARAEQGKMQRGAV
jgi:hypothetical protein